jgi:adenylate cyclase
LRWAKRRDGHPSPRRNPRRRCGGIFAADGADEEGTLERLKALRRELFDPKIAEHHGRIVKTTGDGLLVEFASVVDAVRCAVEVQQAMPERNTDATADSRIELRIGINLGDVIVEGEDLYGDGVNIAARIEALADPSGVLVSNTVHDQVRDRLPFVFEDLGEQQVKNITRPVRVYRVRDAAPKAQLPQRCRSPTSRRSRSCRSRTCQVIRSRNISPTAWSRRSSFRTAISRTFCTPRLCRKFNGLRG